MISTALLKEKLANGAYDSLLRRVYVTDDAEPQRRRLTAIVEGYEQRFGSGEVALFSAPGRTELGGNHTDHQRGCVLAASINLDIVACAAPNGTNVINIQSEGYPMEHVSLDELEPKEEEVNCTAALIRGVAAALTQRGYTIGGFDAYASSDVLGGSGLSSSAAYETMIGTLCNHLFCSDELDAPEIAKIGQYAENVFFGKPCGLLDQMASSVGGVVAIDFQNKENPVIEPIAFPFSECGHALCIVDSGADHADLTEDYAAVPQEMRWVAQQLGGEVLREVPEEAYTAAIPTLRKTCSDRAVLRAAHFFAENRRVQEEAQALRDNDFARFCELSRQSGQSSYMYLQNIYSSRFPQQQAVAVALMMTERLLDGKGAFRVHGGGFAGTIQAFVPDGMVEQFRQGMDAMLGEGMCHVLQIRPIGGTVLIQG